MGFFDGKSQEDKQVEILEWKLKMAQDKKASAKDKDRLSKMEKAAKPKKSFWSF
jgi:hypothetical protein